MKISLPVHTLSWYQVIRVFLFCSCLIVFHCRLSQCSIEQKGSSYLASALEKNPAYLKVLDLSINMVGDEGANELFGKLDISKMKKLEWVWFHINSARQQKWVDSKIPATFWISLYLVGRMYHCGLTASSCVSIGEALKIETSTLLELNLSNNSLEDQGFERLCEGMYAWCRLEKLKWGCYTSALMTYWLK